MRRVRLFSAPPSGPAIEPFQEHGSRSARTLLSSPLSHGVLGVGSNRRQPRTRRTLIRASLTLRRRYVSNRVFPTQRVPWLTLFVVGRWKAFRVIPKLFPAMNLKNRNWRSCPPSAKLD